MDGQLTYHALREVSKDLVDRFQAYIPLLTNRAQWHPEFRAIRVERPDGYMTFAALLNVYIVESVQHPWARRAQDQYIHLTYGITPAGAISCITSGTELWQGAERAYQEPIELWVDAVKQRLQEEVSKRRIQARTQALKEGLVAAVWAPARLAKRLEEGGWDAVEAM